MSELAKENYDLRELAKQQAEQITALKKENARLLNQSVSWHNEYLKQAEQITELWDFIIGSDHQAGCSGGFNEKYRCKCGLRELIKKYKAAQPQGDSDE